MPVINPFDREQKVAEGLEKVVIQCDVKNNADKPWYAWWEFSQKGTNFKHQLRESSLKGVVINVS